MNARTRRRWALLIVQVLLLAAFTTALFVHGRSIGLVVDLVGVALAGIGLVMMRRGRAPRLPRRSRSTQRAGRDG